jgi:hypothetical protein
LTDGNSSPSDLKNKLFFPKPSGCFLSLGRRVPECFLADSEAAKPELADMKTDLFTSVAIVPIRLVV